MSNERDRVICVSLTEAEWQAFIARQPQPVQWLRDRIRDLVEQPAALEPAAAERRPPVLTAN
jgi:hypothetical protein